MQFISIVGTGTDVGKTVASLAVLEWFRKENPLYYKPIQCGGSPLALKKNDQCDANWIAQKLPWLTYHNSYFFKTPASPHYAAKQEQKEIDLEKIKQQYQDWQKQKNTHTCIN